MDFTREPYVKIYSTVSPTGTLWGFFGRCLMDQLTKSANRAGVLALPQELLHDSAAAVASAIGCHDTGWVREYLPKIMEHGAVTISTDGAHLVITRYHEAQYGGIDKGVSNRLSERKRKETTEAIEAGLIDPPFWWRSDEDKAEAS